jgi:polyhydroxyalkanoic acid synthase PhaR subunit
VADQRNPTIDPFAAWRDWLDQTERQLNSYFNQMMGTEQYARFLGQFNDWSLNIQKNMSEAMGRYFASLNLPTRDDLAALGQRLASIEQRLVAIERGGAFGSAASGTVAASAVSRPPRTKKPLSAGGTEG